MIVVLEMILLIRIFGFLIRHKCISPGAKNRYLHLTEDKNLPLTFINGGAVVIKEVTPVAFVLSVKDVLTYNPACSYISRSLKQDKTRIRIFKIKKLGFNSFD